MTRGPHLTGPCTVNGCAERRATQLGVCESCWWRLPPELRKAWQEAWRDDARIRVYLRVRRQCLAWLEANRG